MDLISVIVPVYNAEKYLKKCIESIIHQTYQNLEIFLIDDGSQDSSGQICESYAKKDNRIKVIHKENGGVSSARNVGLELATGDYISFVDSDDWIELEMYDEMLYKIKAENVDVVRCLQNLVYPKQVKKEEAIEEDILIDFKKERKEIIADILSGKKWASFSLMLIKKEIIDDMHLRFDTELIIGEDMLFVLELYSKINSMYWYRKFFYNYNINIQSAMQSQNKNTAMAFNLLILHKKVSEILSKSSINDEKIKKDFALYIFYRVYNRLANQITVDKNKHLIEELFQNNNYDNLLKEIDYNVLSLFGKIIYKASLGKNVKLYYIISIIYEKTKKLR